MNYCSFNLSHFNLFCPATGQVICSPTEMNEKAKSLRGFWISEVLDEPVIPDPKLKKVWAKLVRGVDLVDRTSLEKLLREYPEPNWCTFEVSTSGMACGPVSTTAWFVLDLDVEK